jgi:hypothetical protein
MTRIRSALGIQDAYKSADGAGGFGHLIQGTTDTLIQTVLDPLSLLSGPFLKGGSVAAKIVGTAGKGVSRLARANVPVASDVVRTVGDFTRWGNAVGRELGESTRNTVRGISHVAANKQIEHADHWKNLYADARSKLSPSDLTAVDEAMDG